MGVLGNSACVLYGMCGFMVEIFLLKSANELEFLLDVF